MKTAALTLPLPSGRGVTFSKRFLLSPRIGETIEGQTGNLAMPFYEIAVCADNQKISNLSVANIAKTDRFLTLCVRDGSGKPNRTCSEQPDPQGHAQNWNRFFVTLRMTKTALTLTLSHRARELEGKRGFIIFED
ncbi:MAG TPA: hypothetical protein VK806_04260 [Bacteroidia bacterium]|nr:hypothetical protein [Bacteroidia bacterium]